MQLGIEPQKYDSNYIWIELVPHKKTDEIEIFSVSWPSYWYDVTVQILITATQRSKNRWRILSMGIPKDTPEDDIDEIERTKWYITTSESTRKYPPVQMAWGFKEPPIFILACRKAERDKKQPFKAQLNQMVIEKEPDPARYSVINALRRLGPGICTVISEFGPFEMQISQNGLFHSLRNLPPTPIITANKTPTEMSAHIAAYLGSLIMLKPALMLIRTFTDETTCIKKDKNSIMPVKIKKLHGFATEIALDTDGEQYISWRKLTPAETRRLYELDQETNQAFEFEIKEREYRFV
jgi:hypothetical protein